MTEFTPNQSTNAHGEQRNNEQRNNEQRTHREQRNAAGGFGFFNQRMRHIDVLVDTGAHLQCQRDRKHPVHGLDHVAEQILSPHHCAARALFLSNGNQLENAQLKTPNLVRVGNEIGIPRC